jgi:uncharacterized Zn finger protein (UPF0148 family)
MGMRGNMQTRQLLFVSLIIVLFGAGLLTLSATEQCPQCGGDGTIICPNCDGSGIAGYTTIHGQQAAYGCERCGGVRGDPNQGTGRQGSGRISCPTCGGSGQVQGADNSANNQSSSANAAAERQRALEAQRLEDEAREQRRQEQFQRSKEEALRSMKGITENELGLKGAGGDMELKGIGDTQADNHGLKPLFDKGSPGSVPVDPYVLREQDEFVKMRAVWMTSERQLIQQRLTEPNRWSSSIYASLKTKEPPLPYKKFDELKAGDVLLIAPDDALSKTIRFVDRLSSWEWKSPASHTVLFLKEVNGKKLFLDSTGGGGPHIITGEEFLKKYGHRGAQVAELGKYEVAQPLSKEEGDMLWVAARELSMKELADKFKKSNNLIDKTNYGLYGNDNMVCSETSRWALIKAGRQIPDTGSPYKKLFGVYFGPSNFYNAEQYFIVTPLGLPKQ